MMIDTHQHVFWRGRDDAGLIADMDEAGIDLAWLLTWEIPHRAEYPERFTTGTILNPRRQRSDGSHPGIPFEDLLIAHRRHRDRFVLGYCPDPAQPQAPQMLEEGIRMYGVRICGEWKFRMPLDDPRCLELFKVAGRFRTPVVLHLDVPNLPDGCGGMRNMPMWYGGSVSNLERALQVCPETTFVAHAPGWWREISGDAEYCSEVYPTGPIVPGGRLRTLLSSYPNLYADLSANSALRAMRRDLHVTRDLLIQHADRFLFGRDMYGHELQQFLSSLNLPVEVQERIYHLNACLLIEAYDREGVTL
jgi:predicted TIM-barrel fold metal-dependent hydrolase